MKSNVALSFLYVIANVLVGATQLNADGGALTQVFYITFESSRF